MSDYNVNQTALLKVGPITDIAQNPSVVYDPDNLAVQLAGPDNTPAFSYTYPSDSQIVRTGTGLYFVAIPLTVPGIWTGAWTWGADDSVGDEPIVLAVSATDQASLTARYDVRLEISDTNYAAPLFADSDIDQKLEVNDGNVLFAAADLYEILAGRCAAKIDFTWQNQEFKQRDGAKYFMQMADRTRARAMRGQAGGNEGLLPAGGFPPPGVRYPCNDF